MSYRPEWAHSDPAGEFQTRQPWHYQASAEAWLGKECLNKIREARRDSPHAVCRLVSGSGLPNPSEETDDAQPSGR